MTRHIRTQRRHISSHVGHRLTSDTLTCSHSWSLIPLDIILSPGNRSWSCVRNMPNMSPVNVIGVPGGVIRIRSRFRGATSYMAIIRKNRTRTVRWDGFEPSIPTESKVCQGLANDGHRNLTTNKPANWIKLFLRQAESSLESPPADRSV